MVGLMLLMVVILVVWPELATWLDWHWSRRVGQMVLLCGSGVAVYFLAHGLLGTRVAELRAPAGQ